MWCDVYHNKYTTFYRILHSSTTTEDPKMNVVDLVVVMFNSIINLDCGCWMESVRAHSSCFIDVFLVFFPSRSLLLSLLPDILIFFSILPAFLFFCMFKEVNLTWFALFLWGFYIFKTRRRKWKEQSQEEKWWFSTFHSWYFKKYTTVQYNYYIGRWLVLREQVSFFSFFYYFLENYHIITF